PVGRDDCCRHADQQDGAGAAPRLRPDAGAALRHLHGLLRQWRRLLSLLLLGRARLRPHRAGRHLCPRLPADGRGAALWHSAAAKEDPPDRDNRALRRMEMDETLDKLGAAIAESIGPSITGRSTAFGELTLTAVAADIVKVATFLRDDPRC